MKFIFIGWNSVDGHDKVWAAIQLSEDKVVTVWGRRGKKLSTRIVENDYSLHRLIMSKLKKGYSPILSESLDKVHPEFRADLEKTAFWATFKV